MLCHICDTIDSQMWHYSRTFVKRSTHGCGTTFFSTREKYILESDDYETQKFSPLLNNFSHAHRVFSHAHRIFSHAHSAQSKNIY